MSITFRMYGNGILQCKQDKDDLIIILFARREISGIIALRRYDWMSPNFEILPTLAMSNFVIGLP
jgi:hypothetical protein